MAAVLPTSRVVNVQVTRADRFATISGFGVPLVVTSAIDGESPIDAITRTKLYGSHEEVAEDWDASHEVYKATQVIFSQRPRPIQLRVGYVDPDVLDGEAEVDIADELDALYAQDRGWYWLLFTKEFRGVADVEDAIIAWAETKPIQAMLDTNDPLLENPQDTTNVAARNKGVFDRTSIFYHPDEDMYFAAAVAAYCATRRFDDADSAYTAKFKFMTGIQPTNAGSAAVQAATGFVPEFGQSLSEGHRANMYVNIGGLLMVVEGTTLNAFIDEIHASDWLVARTQEAVLSLLANTARVPYTNAGIDSIVEVCAFVMQRALVAGFLASDIDPDTGDDIPAYNFEVERVEAVSPAQRRQRIAPTIRGFFTYAGAVHYVRVNLTMEF